MQHELFSTCQENSFKGSLFRSCTSSPGLSPLPEGVLGRWRALRSLFCLVLQKFFTSLSVRPGRHEAILAHLLPSFACISTTSFSSSGENLHPLLRQKHSDVESSFKVRLELVHPSQATRLSCAWKQAFGSNGTPVTRAILPRPLAKF